LDVVWDSPSRDEHGSMPIGNGDLAANVWVESDGSLLLYLSKSDSWDDNARLLKLGRVRVRLEPNLLGPDTTFRQRLDLREGTIRIALGEGEGAASIDVRVDAHRPALTIEVRSGRPTTLVATLEPWRTQPRTLSEVTWSDVYCADWNKPPILPMVTEPDVFPPVSHGPLGDEIVWYHRNERTPIPATFWLQGLDRPLSTFHDPILHRTFGAVMTGPQLVASDPRTLRSAAPAAEQRLEIWALTQQSPSAADFEEALLALSRVGAVQDPATGRALHAAWWDQFWDRSWIRVTDNAAARVYPLPDNDLPVAIGTDTAGGNAFRGTIERVVVYGRPLPEDAVASVTRGEGVDGAIVDWRDGDPRSIPDQEPLDLVDGLTIVAWIVPERQEPGGGRIVDKCPVGGAQGWMLDTYPGNSLRLVAGDPPATVDARLPEGSRSVVAATYDATSGRKRLFIDGRIAADTGPRPSAGESVTAAYALQRYVAASAGRGAFPIKFNGSLFTVPRAGHDGGDPDYRRWGPGYWFQNTRLIYWPMFAAGDIDLAQPFFRMYREAMPLVVARSAEVESERVAPGGGAFHETIYFWGTPDNSSFGWERQGAEPGAVTNPYIRHYRSGSIELVTMAIERWRHRPDPEFLRTTVVPLATAILRFYGSFYPRTPDGTLRIEPAASLETWHDATDPLPEIVGLATVLDDLLAIDDPAIEPPLRSEWRALRASLPPVPRGRREGVDGDVLLPAHRYGSLANVENPELYAIWPYRAFGVGKPELEIARRTFAARANRANVGWCQDSIQAAALGLADEAAALLTRRAASKDPKSRFPAFWGPNYDWVPDQDHGSNILSTLQMMLVQHDGRRILLLPAWPEGWDADFRLHAPYDTVLTGRVRDGRLEWLQVDPPARLADVEILGPK
jgi:hypothetical protein